MDLTLKSLSLLLSYPGGAQRDALAEITAALAADRRLAQPVRAALARLVARLGEADLYDLQEAYVGLFDRSRSLSLNLFEHVHGESRDRGSAMVSLVETYRAGGFDPVSTELPDHLPVLLEFLASRPPAEVREMLADAAHILEALRTRLARRDSPYAAAFAALLALAEGQADAAALAALLDQPEDDPDSLEALDRVWAESEVTFGPDPAAGCPQVRDMLAQMDTPARPAAPAAAK